MVCVLHVLKLCLCVHRPHKFPCAGRARRFIPVSLFPGLCMLSVFLSSHLRIFGWILALVSPHQFPGASLTTSSFIHIPWIDGISQNPAEDSSSHSTGCAAPDSWVSTSPSPDSLALVLPSVNLHWKSHPDLSLTWRSAFLIGSERKLLKWMQENIEKFIMWNKRRRRFHSSRLKLPFVSMSATWFLVSTYLIWIFGCKLVLSRPIAVQTVGETCFQDSEFA